MHYDAIVLGTGGVGSAALLALAECGLNVLGLDRFPPGHNHGSSHGESRIIRRAYFEHADYVPLLARAYERWEELERETQKRLFHRVGLLQVGPPQGVVIAGVLQSASTHRLTVESLSAREANERFPGFYVPPEFTAVFEADAGYLLVEDCVVAHACAAVRRGAKLHIGESVKSWHVSGDAVQVTTDQQVYSAARLIITAGAWANDLLADLGVPLRVVRKHLHWFATEQPWYRRAAQCPTYLFELPHGVFYGFPEVHEATVKVAEHSGHHDVVADPLHDPSTIDAIDQQRVTQFVATYMPGVSAMITRHARCFYTLSPDEHFIIDQHPAHPQVVFAAGLSGHGFKFTPVLGEVLAELAIDGRSQQPMEFLRLHRLK